MTKGEFNLHWYSDYPEAVPIGYLLRQTYLERWFRIHSLPESKRYADNDFEWRILLKRQNEIITDMLAAGSSICIVTGQYNWGEETVHITEEEAVFKDYNFQMLDNIDLYGIDREDYNIGQVYIPAFTEAIWSPNHYDKLLKEIANDSVRALFLSFDRNLIIAPYDGGVDFILKDSKTRDYYREKYRAWLSPYPTGL